MCLMPLERRRITHSVLSAMLGVLAEIGGVPSHWHGAFLRGRRLSKSREAPADSPLMAHRTFHDATGRTWQVWSVVPTLVERRLTPPSPRDPPVIERRLRQSPRMKIGAQWTKGWLTFETSGEKRRLAPYPPEWADFTNDQLVK